MHFLRPGGKGEQSFADPYFEVPSVRTTNLPVYTNEGTRTNTVQELICFGRVSTTAVVMEIVADCCRLTSVVRVLTTHI